MYPCCAGTGALFPPVSMTLSSVTQLQQYRLRSLVDVNSPNCCNCVTLLKVMLTGQKGSSATQQGYIRVDPLKGVELPSLVQSQVVPPTVEQVWKLIDVAAEMKTLGYGMIYLGRLHWDQARRIAGTPLRRCRLVSKRTNH